MREKAMRTKVKELRINSTIGHLRAPKLRTKHFPVLTSERTVML